MKTINFFVVISLMTATIMQSIETINLEKKRSEKVHNKKRLTVACVIGGMLVTGGAGFYILRKYIMLEKPMTLDEQNAIDEAFKSVIIRCAQNDDFDGFEQKVTDLMGQGASIDIKFERTKEPILIFLVRENKQDMVELLLQHGADVNILGRYGSTALDRAQVDGNRDMIDLLKQYGAKTRVELKEVQGQ